MLPKTHRSVENKMIVPTIREGHKIKFGPLSFYLLKTNNPLKVVVIVSKKVSKLAVQRNLLRRRLYNILREIGFIDRFSGILVIRVYPGGEKMSFTELKKGLSCLLKVNK